MNEIVFQILPIKAIFFLFCYLCAYAIELIVDGGSH